MIVTGTLITGSLMAGGLVTNNNQSAAWVRLPARDASTEADAAYFNPAGLMKLDNGLHISVSNQTIFQTREIKSTFPYLNSGDFHLAKSLKRHLEIGVERGGGDGIDALFGGILDEVALGGRADFIHQKIIIERLGRDEHESEVHGIFGRFDVFRGLIDAGFQIVPERIFISFAFFVGHGDRQPVIIFQAELRINGNDTAIIENDGINFRIVLERILQLIFAGREDIFQNHFKIIFAEHAALFRVFQDIVQIFQLIVQRHHLFLSLLHFRDLARDLAHDLHAFIRLCEHRFCRITKPHVEHLGELAEPVLKLFLLRLHLVLKEDECLIILLSVSAP